MHEDQLVRHTLPPSRQTQSRILSMSRTIPRDRQTTGAVSEESNEIAPTADVLSSSAGGSMVRFTSAPPRKQARTAKHKSSKKAKDGLLSILLNLPVELFAEIARSLKPIDILSLARTCKSFRGVLMRRSSEFIWKCAVEGLAYHLLPPPPWLDMPQYVSLVYTKSCMACGSNRLGPGYDSGAYPKFQRELVIRLCALCQPNVLIRSEDIPEDIKPLIMIAHVNISYEKGVNMNNGQYGLRDEVTRITKQFEAKKVEFSGDKEKLGAWQHAKRGAIKHCSQRNYGKLIQDISENQAKERGEIKQLFRFDPSVEKRLAELGWEHDICYVPKSLKGWVPLTKQPRKLTDRIWRNLYPKLETFLERARSERLTELPFRQQHAIISLWKNKEHDLGIRVLVLPRHAAA
ncbi:unnamed protein product, partial [Rhizoctonia solani]